VTTTLIVRRDALRARQAQALIETSREIKVLGVAESLYRAQSALAKLDPDTVLLDLRLEDGAALSLVRWLRERNGVRPKIMLVVADAADPLLFATLMAGADAYLLESDLPVAAATLARLVAGEAVMAAPLAVQVLQFFNEPPQAAPRRAAATDERQLDWLSHGSNPMRLSPGEVRLVQMLAQGSRSGEVAARTGQSVEAVGRRIANIYRKLAWDVRRGALSLLAA
jgi:DNA-binding NarL/FixJ family response regulator